MANGLTIPDDLFGDSGVVVPIDISRPSKNLDVFNNSIIQNYLPLIKDMNRDLRQAYQAAMAAKSSAQRMGQVIYDNGISLKFIEDRMTLEKFVAQNTGARYTSLDEQKSSFLTNDSMNNHVIYNLLCSMNTAVPQFLGSETKLGEFQTNTPSGEIIKYRVERLKPDLLMAVANIDFQEGIQFFVQF